MTWNLDRALAAFGMAFAIALPASAARIDPGNTMAVAGVKTFHATPSRPGAVVHWTVDRQVTSTSSGKVSSTKTKYYTATGETATFDLKHYQNDTAYVVKAEDSGVTDTRTVRVFKPDVRTSFVYRHPTQAHPDVRVYSVVPKTLSNASRVLFVMHGDSRTASGYCANWVSYAAKNDTVVLCPYYTDSRWPGARSYNRGAVFANDAATRLNPEAKWSFTALENIHAYARQGLGITDARYDLWGHSAGGQFIHRFLLFKPAATVRLAMAANAGWYLLPVQSVDYPCGPDHPQLGIGRDALLRWNAREAVIFLGTEDTDPDDPETDGCMDKQGEGRYARGHYFYDRMLELTGSSGWRVIDVPEVGHEDDDMAPPAQAYLREYNKTH